MSKTPHALIAGAGIGGLSAALTLQRAGFRVSLFERAKILEEVGAGLQSRPTPAPFYATSIFCIGSQGWRLSPRLFA